MQCSSILPRLIQTLRDDARRDYVFLSHLIGRFIADLFPGTTILGCWPIPGHAQQRASVVHWRGVIRATPLKAVEIELHNRFARGDAVRLEIDHGCPEKIREALLKTFRLTEDDLYLQSTARWNRRADDALVRATIRRSCAMRRSSRRLRAFRLSRGFVRGHPANATCCCIIPAIPTASWNFWNRRRRSRTYSPSRSRCTHRRRSAHCRRIDERGEQRQAGDGGVELRARFDEANNIQWTRRLRRMAFTLFTAWSGRRFTRRWRWWCAREWPDPGPLRSSGHRNYNPTTARLYTDTGLLKWNVSRNSARTRRTCSIC